jgi:hypothetical protein
MVVIRRLVMLRQVACLGDLLALAACRLALYLGIQHATAVVVGWGFVLVVPGVLAVLVRVRVLACYSRHTLSALARVGRIAFARRRCVAWALLLVLDRVVCVAAVVAPLEVVLGLAHPRGVLQAFAVPALAVERPAVRVAPPAPLLRIAFAYAHSRPPAFDRQQTLDVRAALLPPQQIRISFVALAAYALLRRRVVRLPGLFVAMPTAVACSTKMGSLECQMNWMCRVGW